MPKLRAGFVQQMFQKDHTVVWNGSVRWEPEPERPKTVSEPFRFQPEKFPKFPRDQRFNPTYWRKRRKILEILEG